MSTFYLAILLQVLKRSPYYVSTEIVILNNQVIKVTGYKQ